MSGDLRKHVHRVSKNRKRLERRLETRLEITRIYNIASTLKTRNNSKTALFFFEFRLHQFRSGSFGQFREVSSSGMQLESIAVYFQIFSSFFEFFQRFFGAVFEFQASFEFHLSFIPVSFELRWRFIA